MIYVAKFYILRKASARPVVRFCDLSKYVKDSESSIPVPSTSATTADVIQNPSSCSFPADETMDIEGVDEQDEVDDTLWEDEDNEEDNDVLLSARETASSSVMDVEAADGVDVSIPQLRDFLSDTPAFSPLIAFTGVGGQSSMMNKAASTDSITPRVFQVPDVVLF